MDKLKAAGLYQTELITISGRLVERYNACLKTLGFPTTSLTLFSIDGIGWSPEVAEERNDINYLNHGDANPHGIIISPLQKGKPVYMPFHTFDRAMMTYVFQKYEEKIKQITLDSAICLDFDQNIDVFYEPLDILKYNHISIQFRLINQLKRRQVEQLQLIEEFNQGNNFIDETLHQRILESAKTYGDLRFRDLDLPELSFKTDSFYTRAFGGVYVLRDFITPIVVFEDTKSYKEAIKNTSHNVLLYHVSHPELMDKLRDHLIVECDLSSVVNTKRYERIKKYFFAQLLKNTSHGEKDILDNKSLFKSYLNQMDIEERKRVMSVERYLEKIAVSNQYKLKAVVDNALYVALHKPHSSLEIKHQELIWKLLIEIAPLDVLFLFWYDKQHFYTSYQKWSPSMQDWVIETLKSGF